MAAARRLRRAATADEFHRAPHGRYVAGDGFLFFCVDAGLRGVVIGGRPSAAALEHLVALMSDERGMAPRFDAIHDLRGLRAVEPAAFAVMEQFAQAGATRFTRLIDRYALVGEPGLPMAAAVGLAQLRLRPAQHQTFTTLPAAVAWLDRPPAVAAVIDAAIAEATATPPIVGTLRAYLDRTLRDATLAGGAAALGMAPRSLQRALAASGTSFRAELERARLDRADALLGDPSLKVETVAAQVGYASPGDFAKAYRRRHGVTPTARRRA